MKIILAAVLFSLAMPTYAGLNMKPGLWEIELQSSAGDSGKPDPMAKMREAMANMSPEQQKQMAAMMGKMGGGMGISKSGITMKVCYTKEMLENEASLNQQKDKKCTSNVKEKSSSKIVIDFKCEDGTFGDSNWSISDSSNYTGLVNVTDKRSQKMVMNFKGKFVGSECGDVKPKTAAKPETVKIPTH